MFGLLRITLALMVVVNHLFLPLLLGQYAVFGFYIVSGYLMTLVMQKGYGYHGRGRLKFAVNRILRLFPMYWFACLVTILLIQMVGDEWARIYHRSIYLPTSGAEVARNLFMIYPAWHPNDLDPRLVPPTWALTVEMCFYGLICMGISKTWSRVKLWFGVSMLYFLASYAAGWSHADRYYPVAAASLPFSIGAALYFQVGNPEIGEVLAKTGLTVSRLFLALLANTSFWMVLSGALKVGPISELGFYLNMLICAALVYALANGGRVMSLGKRVDAFIGDLSYPVYLLHWQAGLAVSFWLFGAPMLYVSRQGLVNLTVSVLTVLLVSMVMIYAIDRPVQAIRRKIKA